MPNFVIIPDKQNGFIEEPLFLSGSNLIIRGEMPNYLYTGSLHYNFNTKYEALPDVERILAELTVVITNGNKYFAGIKYEPSLGTPTIIMRGSCVTAIKKYCAENDIPIVNKKRLAAKLYQCNSGEYIPVECFEEVAKIIARQPVTYNDLGCTYCDKDDYDRAITNFTRAIKLDPDYSMAYKNRGFVYFLKGDYDNAIADCTEAIRLNPDSALAYNIRGAAYGDKSDYDRAIADFTRAIQLDPAFTTAYTNRGCSYFLKNNYTEARADADIALRIEPDNQDAQLLNEELERQGY